MEEVDVTADTHRNRSPRGLGGRTDEEALVCAHHPACPTADGVDREAARVLVSHPEQGWSLLCNGVVIFEDTGELLPDGRVVAPHRGEVTTVVPRQHRHSSHVRTA
jgi:hypothetical protein